MFENEWISTKNWHFIFFVQTGPDFDKNFLGKKTSENTGRQGTYVTCLKNNFLEELWHSVVLSRSVMSDSVTPKGCSPPGFSVDGILQARILEWVAISFSRGSSQPRDLTQVSCIAGGLWATREAQGHWSG